MIAMRLPNADPSLRGAPRPSAAAPGRNSERAGIVPAGAPATVTAQFQPLDPDIVSDAIPAFFIGRNKQGFWVARDSNGKVGGIFLLENSALAFARQNSEPTGCATIFPSQRFELDLENNGNRLIAYLGPLIRAAMRTRRQIATLLGKLTEALKRRPKDRHIL